LLIEVFFLLLFLLLITVIFVERLTLTEGNYHSGEALRLIRCP